MAIQLKDRILTLCTTVGTNDAIVGATKEGYQGWEGITIGNTVYYCITDDTEWEVGYGSYLDRAGTPTIQRNVLSSSNADAKLELSGNSSIFCTYPSEKAVFLNADDNMYYPTTNINASKFIGDGSSLTNLPNDNVWTDNGSSIEYKGNGSTTTQVWAENNGKYAKIIQKNDGLTYFKGDGATFFGTDSDLPVNIFVGGTSQLAVGKDSVYAFQPVTAPEFIGNGAKITNIDAELNSLAPEAPTDGETYARNNKTWVSISESAGIPDAPVDGLMYGRKDGEWDFVADASDIYTKTETNTLLDEKADKATTYTKSEVDVIDNAQDVKIVINNDEIARQQIEITNNSDNITKNDGAINTNITNIATNTGNIASNTSAIGTLSGQVSQNSEDIAELQDSIFFTSAYTADYPSAPNRDPENGNMYLQSFALFTYSYADATQIFCSKTDESGNVRQFTAVKPGDSIVLNEVDSPNYGRYELVSVSDVSDSYVVMNVIPKLGLGTVITGVKVAFQAFPKVGLWDENETNGYATYPNNLEVNGGVDVGSAANGKLSNTMLGRNASGQNAGASATNNVSVGDNAFAKMSGANDSVAVGSQAMKAMVSGSKNTAIGFRALSINPDGNSNVAIGANAGSTLVGGNNNVLIGDGAEPSAPTVSNEVTLGNNDTTTVRMGNGDIVYPASGGGGDAYTKAESDAIDDAQNVNISANTTAIADTYNKTEINTWQADQDTQISENRVDIATKVGEAPEDGKQYGRKDATWTEVTGGGTLDIDALPALPTELEGTDLFVTERTGTNYKVTADGLSIEATPPTYATWNPLDNNGAVLTVGNLMAKLVSGNNVGATIKPTSGKWYWEISIGAVTGIYIGLKDTDSSVTGFSTDAVAINSAGDIYALDSLQTENGIVSFTNGNVVGVAWDADAKKLWWSKNGQWYTGDLSTAVPIDASEVVAGNRAYDYSSKLGDAKPYIGSSGSPTVTANFGQLTFSYPAPTGFNTISTEG